VFEIGPKLGDDAVGERADSVDEGAKFGDIGSVVTCVASRMVGVKLGDSAAVLTCAGAKRAGKSGDEDSGSAGGASDPRASGHMALAPSSTWS
jgi:hypothetical protein